MVTEESLAIVIHLLNRALHTPIVLANSREHPPKSSSNVAVIYADEDHLIPCREGEAIDASRGLSGEPTCTNRVTLTGASRPGNAAESEFDWEALEDDSDMLEPNEDLDSDEPCQSVDAEMTSVNQDRTSSGTGYRLPSGLVRGQSGRSWRMASGPPSMRWNATLRACPYAPGTSLFENLSAWLAVTEAPVSSLPAQVAYAALQPQQLVVSGSSASIAASVPSHPQNRSNTDIGKSG
ncbi:unnamed protein product [Protopolystoma xenopodis]|uniref:Uncharacterized protein n=1 Tax=Protopolystoma xenopodis TaxID=117903 RepID=A0A3S5CC85_9PLAT|nr:unnamed protein product [Protopolystoma xenopodis]